jgi:DNA polymerase-3 subunit epsilon
MKITAIDFETANRSPASVCAVGISQMEDGAVEEKYYSLIRPEANVSYFDPFNVTIHHITPDMVQDAPEFAEIYPDLKNLFEDSIVCAHNARFDMTCLKKTCLNTGRPVPYLHYFDTVQLSRRLAPQLRHHRLDDMCRYYDIELDHHHAGSDAYGCLMIVAHAMEESGIYDIEELLKYYHTRIFEL